MSVISLLFTILPWRDICNLCTTFNLWWSRKMKKRNILVLSVNSRPITNFHWQDTLKQSMRRTPPITSVMQDLNCQLRVRNIENLFIQLSGESKHLNCENVFPSFVLNLGVPHLYSQSAPCSQLVPVFVDLCCFLPPWVRT